MLEAKIKNDILCIKVPKKLPHYIFGIPDKVLSYSIDSPLSYFNFKKNI